MVEVVAPIRPPEPTVRSVAAPLEPRLTAIQERMARLSEKDGGVLVGGTAQPETPLPATEAAVEIVTTTPESDGRTEALPEDPQEAINLREWLALDINVDNAREMMTLISARVSSRGLSIRLRDSNRFFRGEIAAKRMTEKQAVEFQGKLNATIDQKNKQYDELAKRLKKSANPHDQALIADVDLHMDRNDYRDLVTRRDLLRSTGGATTEIDNEIAAKGKAIREAEAQRREINDNEGNPIEDKIGPGVMTIIEKSNLESITGEPLTAEQKLQLEHEPLGVLEEVMTKLLDPQHPDRIEAFVTNLQTSNILDESQAKQLRLMLDTAFNEKKSGRNTTQNIALGVGGLFLAMAWAAKQREGAAAQGQGGH